MKFFNIKQLLNKYYKDKFDEELTEEEQYEASENLLVFFDTLIEEDIKRKK